ncbi:MAG: alpha/beta hydrolase [Planctomycetota bacterium]|jgi:esterase/lipase superfamily enzyme
MSAMRKPWFLSFVLLAAALFGCEQQLMPTPNMFVGERYEPFEDLPEDSKGSTIDLLYVTDRAPETRQDGTLRYGYRRSRSLAFGSCLVEIGRDVDWETLVANSTTHKRSVSLPVKVRAINELGRLIETPLPLVEIDGKLVEDPKLDAIQQELAGVFFEEVRRRLALAPRKHAFIYVHGFNNTFEYAASVLAEFIHFARGRGLPILYTWPAGSPGLLQGYNHDRESGEFTIYHLRQFIRHLATVPEIERIHILAHSRGTDVAASALRELLIEERGAGNLARESLKIGHVVLASPDMDMEVAGQRFGADRFHHAYEHLTIYVSRKDKAIGLAEWLFRSKTRLGQLRPEDLTAEQKQQIELVGRMDVVDARVKTGFLGHAYYHSNPAVSSDLILTIRGYKAGSPERPLREVAPNYWVLDDERYPFVDE